MSKPAYSCRILSVGKTPMGESDLVITALKEDGSLLRAVAKGARKPTNPFAARLEVFSVCDCLVAPGRNLHVFSEARVVQPNLNLRSDYVLSMASYPIIQAVAKTCHEGLEIPSLFDMTTTALRVMNDAPPSASTGLCAAFLLKLFAMLGFRPNFMNCVICGEERQASNSGCRCRFSYLDGGYLCENCRGSFDVVRIDEEILSWSHALLMTTFDEVCRMAVPQRVSYAVLQLCRSWTRQNLGLNLKSLNALLLQELP